jgi:hypothetical protein
MSERFWSKVDRRGPDECWPWVGARLESGYGRFKLSNQRKLVPAHRFAWELENGDWPEGMFACHHCDNPWCVNPRHVFPGTPLDNMRDMHAKGRAKCGFGSPKGEAHPCHKLTAEEVDLIRMTWETLRWGVTYKSVAKAFNVSPALVRFIVIGKAWAA